MSQAAQRLAIRIERGSFSLDVDLAWEERVAVVFGPSGSGKSTLLEAVLGLHPDARGELRIGGRALDGLPPQRRELGWVPQESALFPHLSVEENLAFGARRAGRRARALRDRAIEMLELGSLLKRSARNLSGGEGQRVAIARALASGPRALLLDEPLASLDLPLRSRVLRYLLRVRDELSLPMLYITHDPDEALCIAEHVHVLDGGCAVASGRPHEVLWSRAVLPLSEALGIENVLETRVVSCAGGELRVETLRGLALVLPAPSPLAAGEALRVGLRAQDILVADAAPGRISARNVIAATVRSCEPGDDGVWVHLEAGETLIAKLTRAATLELELAPGRRVHLIVKAQALRRLP